ncbi:MAG: AsnC family transcriptional regulator [Thermoprotei archaeon]|nr:MAG: AsnC family transcriptional regulator [Thermoprotei archaeon]
MSYHRERFELDEKDRKILRILVTNARTPFSRIARELGLSEASIYVRIRRLEKIGVLRGYTASIDLAKLGYTIRALIMLKLSPDRYREAISQIKVFSNTIDVYEITGEFHIVMKVVARSNEELSQLIDKLGSIPGVLETRTLYVLRTIKEESVSSVLF